MKKVMIKSLYKKNKGFTLLMAIVVTSMLLIASFTVVNVALKQLVISISNKESQYAFYNSESGLECATYWDLLETGSAFDAYNTFPKTISCNGTTINLNSAPAISDGYSTTTLQFTLTNGCAVVDVVKKYGVSSTTKIDSRGYNTACTGSFAKKFERGITLSYESSSSVLVDSCPNVLSQTVGPCADTLCVAPASWDMSTQSCVTTTVVDVCPSVNGNQASGPCADTLCSSGYVWSIPLQQCVGFWLAPGVNVNISGNNLTKNGGTNGAWDAGAISYQTISSGDGYVNFSTNETNLYKMGGLSKGNLGQDTPEIDFGLVFQNNGTYYVYENGVAKTGTFAYSAGNVFTVAAISGVVKYFKNDIEFYTSTQPIAYPLLLDTSLHGTGATITNASITSGTYGAPAPTVSTLPASGVTLSGAVLNGATDPNGYSSTGWFRYDTTNPGTCTDGFGTRHPSSGGTALGSGTTAIPYSGTISSLSGSTTYFFCAISSNINDTAYGNVVSFTTGAVNSFDIEYLVVGGGGGGGWGRGGGGGGGGFKTGPVAITPGTSYTVTIGNGGAGALSGASNGVNGGSSSVGSLVVSSGGGGGGSNGPKNGSLGGSGGGASGSDGGTGGAGISGQGNAGGNTVGTTGGAGGGGAGGVGNPGSTSYDVAGGAGIVSDWSGASATYGRGGSGAPSGDSVKATSGAANSGRGGKGSDDTEGGDGGSGIVVIRYPDSYPAATVTGTYSTPSTPGYRTYVFTGNGTITFNSGSAPSLSSSASSVAAGGSLNVSFSNIPTPTVLDWIGLYNSTNVNSYLAWVYTSSCTETGGATALSSGSCSFTIPVGTTPASNYYFMIFANDGYNSIATSTPNFTVTP